MPPVAHTSVQTNQSFGSLECRPKPTRSEIDGNRIWTYVDSPQTCSEQWHKIFIIVCSSSNRNCYKSWRHISEVMTCSEHTWMMRSVVRISPQPCLGLNNHVHPFHVLNNYFARNKLLVSCSPVWAWCSSGPCTLTSIIFCYRCHTTWWCPGAGWNKSHEWNSLMTCRFSPKVRQEHDHKNYEWVKYVALLWAGSILHTISAHWIESDIVPSSKQLWNTKVTVPIYTIGGCRRSKMSKWWFYLTLNTNSEHQEWYLYAEHKTCIDSNLIETHVFAVSILHYTYHSNMGVLWRRAST